MPDSEGTFIRGELLYSESDLVGLPDHAAISWRRIPGDESSRAIAYVNVEADPDAPAGLVVWLSPGGWQPMSPSDAGVTYPVTVEVLPWNYQSPLAPLEAGHGVLVSGGTWPREHALEAATRLHAGRGVSVQVALDVADAFVDWLTAADVMAETGELTVDDARRALGLPVATDDAGNRTLEAFQTNLADRLDAALEALREASAWNGADLISLAARGRITAMVEQLRQPPSPRLNV